jgi:Flp pilus assembly protein TadG
MMKKINHQYAQAEQGSAVVEFALVLPILLLIVFGIINFGVLLYNQSVITNAAREGARWAAIHSSAVYGNTCTNSYSAAPVDPCQVSFSYATSVLISFGANALTVTGTAANYNAGTAQTVIVNYSYTGVGWFFGGQASKQYSSTAVMLHE